MHTSKEESVEQTGKRETSSYNQDADKVNGSFLNTNLAKPLDNNDFNGEVYFLSTLSTKA